MKIARTASRILAFSVAFAFVAALLAADETTDKVDKLFASWDKTTSPGATLAVIRDGRIIYKRGYHYQVRWSIVPLDLWDCLNCNAYPFP